MRAEGSGIVEERPIGARQLAVLVLVVLALVIDGIDIQLLSLVAPVILKEWGVDRSALGPALSAALIGLTLGAAIGGWLGDRFGRKTVLIGAMLLFGLATIAVSMTDDLFAVTALRLVSGLGFGAVAPNGAALVTEWLPIRIRSIVIPMLSITIPLGGLLGASAVLALLSLYGWRGVFVACGALTLLLAAILAIWLPESAHYLLGKGRGEAASRVTKRILGTDAEPARNEARPGRASIFTRANLRFNTGAWLAYFSLQFIAYAFIAWAPTFLTVAGWPLPEALRASMVFNLSAIGAAIATGLVLRRTSSRPVILIGCAGTLASVILIAAVLAGHGDVGLTLLATGGVGAFTGAGIAAIYILLAFVYPVECRASGIGMGLMMGRAGGIAVTLVGGWLLTIDGNNLNPFFASLVVATLAAFVGTVIVGPYLSANIIDKPRHMT